MSVPLVRLPSLDLLRGFVAVGRRMSITLAAQDLCLTQSAVSRQIHALEEAMGFKLLVRGHRSIALTHEGERLFLVADRMVRQLQDVVGVLKGPSGRQVVTITATIGVAGLWLVPRLGNFFADHPDIEVRISANSRVVDLAADGIDLAIRYDSHDAAERGGVCLFSETIVPMAHPSLGISALTPELIEQQVLLEFDGPYRPWLQWSEWLASQGWSEVRAKGILRFNQYDQIIHAAVAGQGIALGRHALVGDMLADGRLKALTLPAPGPSFDRAYWLIQAEADPSPAVREVVRWILAEAGASRVQV